MLELTQHGDASFCSLSYSDDFLPSMGSLEPKHLQEFLKRLRKAIEPSRIRYFAVGEYGEKTFRPHYHLAIFGLPTCRRGRTYRRPGYSRPEWKRCCAQCDLVGTAWGYGDVDLGIVEIKSAQYLAGYVQKKMTHSSDPRLAGRHPEFSRMSLKPGLGAGLIPSIAQTYLDYDLDQTQVDVSSTLRHGGKEWPLGQYLKRKLRKIVIGTEKTPQAVLDQMDEEMRPLRENAFNNSQSLQKEVTDKFEGKRASIMARDKIFKQAKDKL